MKGEEHREFWPHAPYVLDDPWGWRSAWWERLKTVALLVGLVAFVVLGPRVIWRLVVHGEVKAATFEIGGMLAVGIVLALQDVLRRRRRREPTPKAEESAAEQ